MDKIDLNYLNAFFKTNEDLREYLEIKKKIVLPSSKNKGVTTRYLMMVAKDEVLTIPEDRYRHFRGQLQKSAPKTDIHDMILEISTKATGFTSENLPDRAWLLDMLFSLDPKHELFKTTNETLTREFPAE